MAARTQQIPYYALSVGLLLILGLGFDLLVIGTVARLEPLLGLTEFLGEVKPEESLLILFVSGLLLILVTLLIYAISLDPFRSERPSALVYLNFLPLGVYLGSIVVMVTEGLTADPSLTSVVVGGFATFAFPTIVLMLEAVGGKVLLSLGQFCDNRGWSAPAYLFLKNSLRWRPAEKETARRSGFLLAEMGRYGSAMKLLSRLEEVANSEDYDVLRVLEKAHLAEGNPDEAFECLLRQRELNPDLKELDLRVLSQALAIEQWDYAIQVLESGLVKLDIPRLCQLHELYFKTGNIAQAMARARQVAEMEAPPLAKSISLFAALLDQLPENIELRIDLGTLLQKAGVSELSQQGAEHLEKVLEQDSARLQVRRLLANYYLETMQYEKAESHYQKLIEAKDPDPTTYLRYTEVLVAKGAAGESEGIYLIMQDVCAQDFRGFYEHAAMLHRLGRLDEAEAKLDSAQEVALAEEMGPLNLLRTKIAASREEIFLEKLSEKASQDDADFEERAEYIEQLIRMSRGDRAVAECDSLLEDYPEALSRIETILNEGIPQAEHNFRLRDYLTDLYFREARYDDMLRVFFEMAKDSMHPEEFLQEGCKRILSRAPDHWEARLTLGDHYLTSEQWEAAAENASNLPSDPPPGEWLKLREQFVYAARRSGETEAAMESGLEILDEMRENIAFLLELIDICEEAGNAAKANEIYEIAIEKFPHNERLKEIEQVIEEKVNRERLQVLSEAAEKDTLTSRQHYEKAELHRLFEENQEAIVHYQRAADDEQYHDLGMAKLALCLCERKMFDLANETLEKVELTKESTRKHPELINLYYRVADALDNDTFKSEANKYFKRLFQIDASYKDIVARLARLGDA